MNPVTSPTPISDDAFASGGGEMKTVGGSSEEYPLPNEVILMSVIAPLKIVADAFAPVPPYGIPEMSFLLSTI